jgi:hypothetical protein
MSLRNGNGRAVPSWDAQPVRGADFSRLATSARASFLCEVWDLLRQNRNWWLMPVVAVLLLVAGLLVLSAALGPAAPFIYPLF